MLLHIQMCLWLILLLQSFIVNIYTQSISVMYCLTMSENEERCLYIKFCNIREMVTAVYELIQTAFEDARMSQT